jgi:hypothetical protein
VTIEGGPGWQVDAPPGDTIGEVDRPERDPLWLTGLARRVPLAVVVAVAVGFGSATLLADWRTDRLGETDAGALSLEVAQPQDWGYAGLSRTRDGRVATTVLLDVRNTGPRDVALDRVWLEGTAWASEDVQGRRIEPRSSARVVLLRPIDCDRLPEPWRGWPEPTSPAVVVRAVTEAGPREQRVPAAVEGWSLSGESDRRACGEVPVDEAVQPVQTRQHFSQAGTELRVELANASRHDVTVNRVRVPPGLQVQVLDPSGLTPLPMPLRLPAGDFREPHQHPDAGLPSMPLMLRVSIADCVRLAATRPAEDEGRALVELDVESASGNGVAHLFDGFSALSRLHVDGC